MSLIVEDGTGRVDAESYVAVTDADSYFSTMGGAYAAAWAAASQTNKENALRRGTQYIDSQYRFRGMPVNVSMNGVVLVTNQALSFPRTLICYPWGSTAPQQFPTAWPIRKLTQATCEMAGRALSGDLYADRSGGDVIRESVGPISSEYAQSGLNGQTRYVAVDSLLKELTGGGVLTGRLERA